MFKRITLPGSGTEESGGAAAAGSGRLSEDELGALREVAGWWRNRNALGDSAEPLESHFGGVDAVGGARTVGGTTSTVAFARPLLPTRAAALLVMALGWPTDGTNSHALAALCHFARLPDDEWFSRAVMLAQSPTGAATAVLVAIDLASGRPVLQIQGASGQTIDWKVEVLRLESGE